MSPKLKFFLPIVAGIVLSVSIITLYSISRARQNIYDSLERNLTVEVQTIRKMLEREQALKMEKVKTALRVAHDRFYSLDFKIGRKKESVAAVNQISQTRHTVFINVWTLEGAPLTENNSFVDRIRTLTVSTATVFQKIDSGYLRISTNVMTSEGERAAGTFIPNNSPVIRTVEQGETYFGRAYVVNDWYITAYEPLIQDGETIGMLYVGVPEKDLSELRSKINELRIGKTGFPFILNEEGVFVIHPYAEGENWSDEKAIQEMIRKKKGILHYVLKRNPAKKIAALDYIPEFRLIVAAAVPVKEETGTLIRNIIINSSVIALLIIIGFSLLTYLTTADKLRNFLVKLEESGSRLKKTEEALEQSERHFRTLFNNSSDDIYVMELNGDFLEVNNVGCESLGYSREELLSMNIRQVKTEKYRSLVEKNLEMIRKLGHYRYESENLSKAGKVIPVEMKSRLIDFRENKAILTIARDITERRETEERILSTIIRTEENERKRFSADLHDGLGPVLSTIKLYTDLIKKGNYKNISQEEAVRNIDELVDMAISSTREISRNIRPNILQDFGLAAAIHDFCGYINETKSLNIQLDTQNYSIVKRGLEETILYQAVKELVNNTLKHSGAENVKIELKSFENQIILYYKDDGQGFNVADTVKDATGLGLNNIINKIKSVKGTVDINSEHGKGMFLIASIKLRENKE